MASTKKQPGDVVIEGGINPASIRDDERVIST